MISAQQVVDLVLAEAARLGGADETIVLVTDRGEASLRWAGNSMTTNGESVSRATTVISIVRRGDTAHRRLGAVQRGRPGGDRRRWSRRRSRPPRAAPEARDSCAAADRCRRRPPTGTRRSPGTGADVFADVARSVWPAGFRGADQLYGFARHDRGHDVPGDVDRAAAALHPAHRLGGDQRQTRRRQRLGGRRARRTSSTCQPIRMLDELVDCGWAGRSAPSSCPPGATRR